MDITNYRTDEITREAFEGTKSYSQLELELPVGKYQLRITNFTNEIIEYISVTINEGKSRLYFEFGSTLENYNLIIFKYSFWMRKKTSKGASSSKMMTREVCKR
jgi:hypothetical protein